MPALDKLAAYAGAIPSISIIFFSDSHFAGQRFLGAKANPSTGPKDSQL
jgi:hypothetical protein